jgi:uncharacterized protein (DUF1778 family)
MGKLFKKILASEKRNIRCEILLNEVEAKEIRNSAQIRNLSVADFMRRSAMGRRADVEFDKEIVLTLRKIVQLIRELYTTYIAAGVEFPKNELGSLIDEALVAMKRISK